MVREIFCKGLLDAAAGLLYIGCQGAQWEFGFQSGGLGLRATSLGM